MLYQVLQLTVLPIEFWYAKPGEMHRVGHMRFSKNASLWHWIFNVQPAQSVPRFYENGWIEYCVHQIAQNSKYCSNVELKKGKFREHTKKIDSCVSRLKTERPQVTLRLYDDRPTRIQERTTSLRTTFSNCTEILLSVTRSSSENRVARCEFRRNGCRQDDATVVPTVAAVMSMTPSIYAESIVRCSIRSWTQVARFYIFVNFVWPYGGMGEARLVHSPYWIAVRWMAQKHIECARKFRKEPGK